MSRAAVTGGTGRIGTPLLRALVRSGREVRALTRRPRPPMAGVQWVLGDLDDEASLAELVSGADILFHAAGQMAGNPVEVERSLVGGTAAVLRVATAIRVVHLSSLVVLRTAAGAPEEIDEQSPLEPTPERRGIYTRAKAASERLALVAAAGQDVVIVRPGLVFDRAAPLPISVGWHRAGFDFLVGPGDATLPVVFPEDLARGLIVAAEQLPPAGVLHLVDPTSPTRRQLLELLRRPSGATRPVDMGGMVLALAALANASRVPKFSEAAYRLLSAATPHRWSAVKAVGLGWRAHGDVP